MSANTRLTKAQLLARIDELEREVATFLRNERPSRRVVMAVATQQLEARKRTPEVPFSERCKLARDLAMKSHSCVRVG